MAKAASPLLPDIDAIPPDHVVLHDCFAYFSMVIKSPYIERLTTPIIHEPELLPHSREHEFVYPIHDYGNELLASKSTELFVTDMSQCKLYYTIEKMVYLIIERLKSGGVGEGDEVQVAIFGFLPAQRKAFESIINLSYNLVVVNFDPGAWGERYLANVKVLAEKGYGYPSSSPRDVYRISHHTSSELKR